MTVAELGAACGFSRAAAEAVIGDLRELGWLDEHPPEPGMGRPAIRWRVRGRAVHVLALDIGAHHVTAMVSTLDGAVLAEEIRGTDRDAQAEARLEAAAEVSATVLSGLGLAPADVAVCAVATPGIVHEGVIEFFGGGGMPGWVGTNLEDELAARTGIPTVAAGDCALGALGESWLGSAQGHQDVVYILSGIRTGAASVIGGRVHAGLRGGAGLIGELPELRWREIEGESFASDSYPQSRPGRERIFDLARSGDEQAHQAVREFARVLALGSAAMVLAVGPSHLVVGGRFSVHADLFLDHFTEELVRRCPIMPEVSVSSLGARAICLGAVRHGLDHVGDTIKALALNTDHFPAPGTLRTAVQ